MKTRKLILQEQGYGVGIRLFFEVRAGGKTNTPKQR